MKVTVHLSNDFRKTCWINDETARQTFEQWCLQGTYDNFGFSFTADAMSVDEALNVTWGICNSSPAFDHKGVHYEAELHCPPDYENVVQQYRDAGNRSLSVGDLVIVDGQRYGVKGAGFVHVTSVTLDNYIPATTLP